MEKILLVTDPSHLHANVLEFACYVSKLTRSKLIGLFLEHEIHHVHPVMQSRLEVWQSDSVLAMPPPDNKIPPEAWEQNIRQFRQFCENRGVNCTLHVDRGTPLAEVMIESRFADMLIVDPEMTFEDVSDGFPSAFIKEVLAKSECPVIIAPQSFDGIDEIVFAYDGSSSSVFAIKQFTYLFPQFTDKKITIFEADESHTPEITEKDKIHELIRMHYSTIAFQVMRGKASDELFGYLLNRKNAFVVLGAFGRNMLSGFFRRSVADLVIKTINLPVFIAHH
ncbi:MAG TPA: universal stress protein [Chitinophagaceae bacterium]